MTVYVVTGLKCASRDHAIERLDRYALLRYLNEAPVIGGEADFYLLPDFSHLKRFRHYEYPRRIKGVSLPLLSVVPVASPPTTPGNLTATAVSETQVNLTWDASSTDDGYVIAQYNVYQDGVLIAAPTGTAYSVTGLNPWTQYTFTIEAVDNRPLTSSQASVTVRTLDQTAPTTPELTLSATQASILASWAGSADTGSGVAWYALYLNGSLYLQTAGTTVAITGLSASTDYEVSVVALDGAGNASSAAVGTITTEAVTDTSGLISKIAFETGDHLIFRFEA